MKVSSVAAFAYGVGTVSAFGYKGAVERGMWFADYVAEEVFNEEGHTFKTAPGCIGTRTGLRGQKKRCTLVEFLDHVWHSTELPVQNFVPQADGTTKLQNIGRKEDKRPDKAAADKFIGKKSQDVLGSDLTKMADRTNSYTTKPIRGPMDVAEPARGYTGNLDMSKVYNGYAPEDFYRGLKDSGAYRKQVAKEIEDRIKADEEKPENERKFTNSQKKQLRKWAGEGKFGAEYDYELRIRDAREFELNPQKDGPNDARSLSEIFGHPVETKNHEYSSDRLKNAPKLGNYPEADRDATAEKYKSSFGGDVAKAKAAFDDARNEFLDQDLDHKSALNSAEDNVHGSACPI